MPEILNLVNIDIAHCVLYIAYVVIVTTCEISLYVLGDIAFLL